MSIFRLNIKNFFSKGDRRTLLMKKNILASFLLKGCSIIVSFMLVPMTLGYLNPYEYGIWLTLSSVLSWIYLLDIGLGNGLRNKLAEARANGDMKLGKVYVSTTFFFMAVIIVGFYILFLICHHFLDWYIILNVDPSKVSNLNSIVVIVMAFFCLSFVFRMIGNVFMAYQLPAINDLLSFVGSIFSLIIIFILTKTTTGSLLDVAMTFSAVPALVYALAIPLTFLRFKEIAPSFKAIKVRYFNSLISVGFQFMLIQIACLIIFMTSNIIISNLFGPQEVTPFNIANKLFTILTMTFTIIVTPYWSAITEAYTKGEMEWIRHNVKRLRYIWILLTIVGFILVIMSPLIYHVWIGDSVNIPFSLSLLCCLYAVIQNWNNIYSYSINGIGVLRLSILCAVFQAFIYIPLTLYMGSTFGLNGIVASLCLTLLISSIIAPIQFNKIINQHAKGIWMK